MLRVSIFAIALFSIPVSNAGTVTTAEYLQSCADVGSIESTAACMGYTLGAVDATIFQSIENGRAECMAVIKQIPHSVIIQATSEFAVHRQDLYDVNAYSVIRSVIFQNWCP